MLSPLKRKIDHDMPQEPQTSAFYINHHSTTVNGFTNGGGDDAKISLEDDDYNQKLKPCCQKFKINGFSVKNFASSADFSTAKFLDRRQQQFFVHYLSNHCDTDLSTKIIEELLNAEKFTNCVSIPLIDHILKLPSSRNLIGKFLDSIIDIPENSAVKILKFCIRNIDNQDQISDDDKNILCKLLRKDFSTSLLIQELKSLSYNEATVLVQFITTCLSNRIFGRGQGDISYDEYINFASCLLDAQSTGTFQRCENFRDEISKLGALVTTTVLMMDFAAEKRNMRQSNGIRLRDDYRIEILYL